MGIPGALRTALTAAVADDPTRRPADGAALADLLTDAPGAPVATPSAPTPAGPPAGPDVTELLPVPARAARGRRAAAVLTVCVLAGGALATAFPGLAAAVVR